MTAGLYALGWAVALYLAIAAVFKAGAHILRAAGAENDVVTDIADQYGYLAHGIAGYIVAQLLYPHYAISALLLAAYFAYYEYMHYKYPDSRKAIIEFMAVYAATLVALYGIHMPAVLPT